MLTQINQDFFYVFFILFYSSIFNELLIEMHPLSSFEKIFISHVILIIFLIKFNLFTIIFYFFSLIKKINLFNPIKSRSQATKFSPLKTYLQRLNIINILNHASQWVNNIFFKYKKI